MYGRAELLGIRGLLFVIRTLVVVVVVVKGVTPVEGPHAFPFLLDQTPGRSKGLPRRVGVAGVRATKGRRDLSLCLFGRRRRRI